MEKMKLNIQRFADEGATTTDTASVEKPEANTTVPESAAIESKN